MNKWLAVAGTLAAFASSPGQCTRPAQVVNPCVLDAQGKYVPAKGCPVSTVPPRKQDKNCADPREPCHYTRPANVDMETQEKVRG